jgi:hypothetical protein
MGGEMLARAIVDNDRAWQMFSPFALVWAGGALGRAAQQVSGWSHEVREMFEGALARTRDARRRRAAAAKLAAETAAEAAAVAPPAVVPDRPSAVAEPVVEPIAEPRGEPQVAPEVPPAAAAIEPEPAAVAEATLAATPEVTYGSSGVAEVVAPSDVPVIPPDVPAFMKRKRGKRRKSGPNAPAPDRPPPEDGAAG